MWERTLNYFRKIKDQLSRTIFTKYLLVTSLTLLLGFILLGVLVTDFVSRRWESEQQELLAKNARSVSVTASKYFERNVITSDNPDEEPQVTYTISENYIDNLRTAIVVIGESIQSDVFVVSAQGEVLICSEDMQVPAITVIDSDILDTASEAVPEMQEDAAASPDAVETAELAADTSVCMHRGHLPSGLVAEAARSPEYRTTGTLSGIYSSDHFIVGIPIVAKNEYNEDEIVAFVFAASSAQSVKAFRSDVIRVVVIVIIIAAAIALVAVYMITYQQVRPLRQMAYTVARFASGDYGARVRYKSSNEVGQLAQAFNEMAEAIAASEKMHRSFIANVSHELKTPMQTISGFIDGILDGTIPHDRQSQYLRIVSTETKRLARLVRSMLALSRIDSGEMQLNISKFDITNTVFTTMLSFEQKIEEKHIEILGLEYLRQMYIKGDQDLIHQVVYNLVENAVKFTNENGYIKIKIRQRGNDMYISICNSGMGIPSTDINHIFDRFYKTDKSRSQDKTGVGLGLYIVKTIITLHGGKIEARSQEGSHCEFEFHLPIGGPSEHP